MLNFVCATYSVQLKLVYRELVATECLGEEDQPPFSEILATPLTYCHELLLRAARSVLNAAKMSDFTIASILSDMSNLGIPKHLSPKLPWLPMSLPVTPRPQQENQPWSPTSSCWLSHSGPTPKPA